MNSIRQGDVLLVAIKEVPAKATKIKPDNGRLILAYGEVTGHAHAIRADKRARMLKYEKQEFLIVEGETDLVHQEHGTIALAPGSYEVIHQVDFRRKALERVTD